MRCSQCNKEFEEMKIQESHDVPCYLFNGNRKTRKNQADKFSRRWLCQKCHQSYELAIQNHLIKTAKYFAEGYFINGENNVT